MSQGRQGSEIPGLCSDVYNGKKGFSIDTSLKKYRWHIRLELADKSAVTEQIELSHPAE
jgi:hypothetical protein